MAVSRLLDYFGEIVLADTEFRVRGNGLYDVRCICALELRSGKQHRVWTEPGIACPYPLGSDSLFIAYYASAELLSHQSLGWPLPVNVIDLCIEFSATTSGRRDKSQGRSLVAALMYFRLGHIEATEKDDMRALAMSDKPTSDYTPTEREALLDYCASDVTSLKKLLPMLEPFLLEVKK